MDRIPATLWWISGLLIGVFSVGCSGRADTPSDPKTEIASTLQSLPHVHSIEIPKPVQNPSHRIIHILNFHYVPKDLFAADLRDQDDFTDDEIDQEYADFLDDVEAVQQEQMELLRALIKQEGIKKVFYEGLAPEDMPAFRERIENLKEFGKIKPKGETPIEQLMLMEYREDLLQIGAPGRLMMTGELEVLPVEDASILKKANPVSDSGVKFDSKVIEAREDAMVLHLLSEKLAVVILGGGHDLSDNVPDGCEYVRVAFSLCRIEPFFSEKCGILPN